MSGFTSEALEKKLSDLNNSQQSIQTLSLWLIHHRKHNKVIVSTWAKELKKAKQSRKLTFMYLANDVIQNSRKKGPEYSKEFGLCLKGAFENVAKDADDKTWAALTRILKIWEERNIYDSSQIASFRQALGQRKGVDVNNDKSSDKNKSVKSTKHESKDRKKEKVAVKRKVDFNVPKSKEPEKKPALGSNIPLVDSDTLIRTLQEMENSASSDANVREKIASLPPEVSDASLLDKIRDKGDAERLSKQVDEACVLLADYNSRLSQELEERKNISILLSNFIQNQKDALVLAEQKLGEYKDKLRRVTQVRNELKSHLENLPDLSQLPSVTTPLPSACDLFNIARANAIANLSKETSSSSSPMENTPSPITTEYEIVTNNSISNSN